MPLKTYQFVTKQSFLSSLPNNIIVTEQGESDNVRTILEKFKRGQPIESSNRSRSFIANVEFKGDKPNIEQLDLITQLPTLDLDIFQLSDLHADIIKDIKERKVQASKKAQVSKVIDEKKQESDNHTVS